MPPTTKEGQRAELHKTIWRIITINSLEAEPLAARTILVFPRMWGICRQ